MARPFRFHLVSSKPMKLSTASAFVVIALLWGTAWIPYSAAQEQLPRFWICALSSAIAALFATALASVGFLFDRRHSRPRRSANSAPSLLLGFTAIALPQSLNLWAVGRVSPGLALLIFALLPLATLLQSGNEAPGALPKLAIGVGGVAMVVSGGISPSPGQIAGVILTVLGTASSAFSLNYARRNLRDSDLLTSCAIQYGLAALLLGVLSFATERGQFVHIGWQTVVSLLVLGIAIGGETRPIYYWLLLEFEAWRVASIEWIVILVAALESAFFLRINPSTPLVIGGVLIVLTVISVFRARSNLRGEA